MDRARDGGPLSPHVQARRPQRRQLQRARPRGPGKGRAFRAHRADRLRRAGPSGLRVREDPPRAHALSGRGHGRDGRPDAGRRQGRGRRGSAPGPDGPRRRHPPDHGHATPVGGRDHRHHQGQLPDPDLLPGHVQDRQPHHPGRTGRRAAAGSGRHALHGRRRPHHPPARPLRHRSGSRGGVQAPAQPGRARLPRPDHRRAGRRRRRRL
ncbi:hypothetical protein D3C72_1227280 [compost metagenome]